MSRIINLLDENTINKISAGEVVEKPASVVKELIENSIDAKSSKITIEILDGGKELIRITDNGLGIMESEIEKCFLRHATSKIQQIDDLYNLYSLGFRGEAMASIASVSKVSLITKTKEDKLGTKLIVEGGRIISKEKIACSLGTTIIVENLFFNTPARKKFLKSSMSENINILDIINKLSLGNPEIIFKYMNNNKVMLTTPGDNSLINTVRSIYGKEISSNLIALDIECNQIRIEGYIGNNNIYRNNRMLQHTYVNGRYVKTQLIQFAIHDAYKTLIPINKHGICFLNLHLPPNKIDVNIHPTKLEIKFEEEEIVTSFIREEITKKLLDIQLIPSYERKSPSSEIKSKLFNNNRVINTDKPFNDVIKDKETIYEPKIEEQIKIIPSEEILKPQKVQVIKEEEPRYTKTFDLLHFRVMDVLFNTYILCEFENSLYFVDQHAAHERILYEQYMDKFNKESIAVQMLLSPIVLDITNSEMLIIGDKLELFSKFGFEVEIFGNNSIIVRTVPNIFGIPESERFILELIHNIDDICANYELKKDKIASMSCKSAIKASDRIEGIEIAKLFRDLCECKNPYTCPHGRPIIVEMKKHEIEKMFKRII